VSRVKVTICVGKEPANLLADSHLHNRWNVGAHGRMLQWQVAWRKWLQAPNRRPAPKAFKARVDRR
jgi:hypothetical protein